MRTRSRPFAVVTGASTSIGFHLARQCVDHGFDVLIAANESAIHTAAAELSTRVARVDAIEVDLATADGVDELLAVIEERPVDALLANVGSGPGHGFLDQPRDEARRVVDTHGTIHLIHHVGRAMRSRGSGRILITGSSAGPRPGGFQAVYDGSKAFLDAFSCALRDELEGSGVHVSVLMPAATAFERADMQRGAARNDDAADVAKAGFVAMMNGEADIAAGFRNRMRAVMRT
jgi:uncharacterized protein